MNLVTRAAHLATVLPTLPVYAVVAGAHVAMRSNGNPLADLASLTRALKAAA